MLEFPQSKYIITSQDDAIIPTRRRVTLSRKAFLMDLPWIVVIGVIYVIGGAATFFLTLAVDGFMSQTGNGKDQSHLGKAFLFAIIWPLLLVFFTIWVFTVRETHPARRTPIIHSAPPPH